MSEQSFEQLLAQEYKNMPHIRPGAVVDGTVIGVKPDEATFNIGAKSDGVLSKSEYSNETGIDLTTVLKEGDKLPVQVLRVNDNEGTITLTYKRLASTRGSKKLEEAFNSGEVLKAKVIQILNGGVNVIFDEIRVFIPASLVSDTFEKDLGKYNGQELEFKLIEYNPKGRRYIGDRKSVLKARSAILEKEVLERIKVGDIVEGTVKNVTDFGAFVDLGGLDGLLHISQMSWNRVDNPRKFLKSGDRVRVLIRDINGKKVGLSMKFEDNNPWKGAQDRYSPGQIVKGKVARMTDFGAFIELETGIDALMHVSQISWEHVGKPSDVFKEGEEVEAKILDFNPADQKISLSRKALLSPKQAQAPEDKDVDGAAVAETGAADSF